jgi:glycine/serine hydroxymethyltransferase
MIKVQKLHAELKRRLNRIFSDYHSHLSAVDVDAYINQAKEILLENYSTIVEKNRIISDRLRGLEIKNKKLELIS